MVGLHSSRQRLPAAIREQAASNPVRTAAEGSDQLTNASAMVRCHAACPGATDRGLVDEPAGLIGSLPSYSQLLV